MSATTKVISESGSKQINDLEQNQPGTSERFRLFDSRFERDWPVGLDKARALGSRFYWSNTPCKHSKDHTFNGLILRYTNSTSCVRCDSKHSTNHAVKRMQQDTGNPYRHRINIDRARAAIEDTHINDAIYGYDLETEI